MKLNNLLATALVATTALSATAQTQAHFDMSLNDKGEITELVSATSYKVASALPPCNATGIDGKALRFDGYSTEVGASINTSTLSENALTVNVRLAAETYPMMQTDVAEDTPTYATIFGNLKEDTKTGFAWELSSQGDLRFRYGSATGFLMTINGNKKLPRGQWADLTAVLDVANNAATIYLNAEQIGTGKMSSASIATGENNFYIGRDATSKTFGPFTINAFCGLIDDIIIWSEALDYTLIDPLNYSQLPRPDFNYPAERYAESLWRPQFHGMPSGAWTNESHGMMYSGGKWHVFFQKNANGPYMSRLHWGHISSENLYEWTEEPIAIYPGEDYDIKGCWSGCVYEDGGTPYILYTAVDNAKATIAQAKTTENDLKDWEKLGIIINGKPAGLSDDFRDPYFFTANGQKYVIVGTSKNNIGTCTLHKYENGAWTNDGSIFFQGGNANQHGTFWEMPNVTDMGNGKWLFTCTPLGTGAGVRTLCWTGTIGSDGKFTAESEVQYLEMGGISRDGYGMLSPTICQKDGKTVILGIVPDKLSGEANYKMGWAHNYSLPREISLTADGSLIQKPYSGLTGMRSTTSYEKSLALTGSQSLAPVGGRYIELLGEFTVASGTCGFNFLKSGSKQASLSYDTDKSTLTLDLTTLDRTANDNGSYKGIYSAELPKKVAAGEKLKLHVYLDGSIADIFVNDTWAFSVRIFSNDAAQTDAEAFATAEMKADIKAWTLKASGESTGIAAATTLKASETDGKCYDLQGHCLPGGQRKEVYIQGGKKYVGR